MLAKAPVPGRAKTRLCPPATPEQAAGLAAAALADTLAAARRVPAAQVVVALDGEPDPALAAALEGTTVIAQRGGELGERIAGAHADVARLAPGACTVLIGMDTPQLDPAVLGGCLDAVSDPDGPAASSAASVRVAAMPELTDVDTMVDAHTVASACPGSRFATLLAAVGA